MAWFYGIEKYKIAVNFYKQIIVEGKSHKDFPMKKEQLNLVSAGEYVFDEKKFITTNDELLWRTFHLGHFMIPLPIEHPIYDFIPLVEYRGKKQKPLLGFQLANYNKVPKLILKMHDPVRLSFLLGNKGGPKIFQKPYLDGFLDKYSTKDIWRDLFALDLLKISKQDNLDLIPYNLLILALRQKYFLQNVEKIQFYNNGKIGLGITSVKSDKVGFKKEYIWYLIDNKVYKLELIYNKYDLNVAGVRKKFLDNIIFRYSTKRDSRLIYEEFQNYPYTDRIGKKGLILMYSAWTHTYDSPEFLKTMIHFLERGENSFAYLSPLYSFAKNRFGENFSKYNNIEKQRQKLKRKIEDYQQKEEEEILKAEALRGGEFASDEERVRYYLQKAKDKEAQKQGFDKKSSKQIILE